MKIIEAKLDYSYVPDFNYMFFTGNRFIKRDGSLVMGRGAALEVKNLYPNLPKILGAQIQANHGKRDYHLEINEKERIGVFQVKRHYFHSADVGILAESARNLRSFSLSRKEFLIKMNFPGIGNGGLTFDRVLPLVQQLPDNVHLYYMKGLSL